MKNLAGVGLISLILGVTVIGVCNMDKAVKPMPNVEVISGKQEKVVKVQYKPKEIKKVDRLAIV